MAKIYIELNEALEVIKSSRGNCDSRFYDEGLMDACSEIIALNPADVAPVVHGEWMECGKDDNDMTIVQCSICQIKRYGAPAYCSRCGAKMDGGSKND